MKQRPLKMDAWGISFDEYKELYHFCQQYHRKKQRLADMITLKSSCAPSIGGGTGTSDTVGALVARRERLSREIDMIEQSAREADAELAQWILRAVTTKDGIRRIAAPCGVRQFTEARRRFFYILWTKKNMT